MSQVDNVEGNEICIGDVYKLLLHSSNDIADKIDRLEIKLNSVEEKYDTTIKTLKEKVHTLEIENKDLKTRLTEVDRKLRRKNLIFYGIPEEQGENIVNVVEKILEERLEIKLEVFDITNAFRLGKKSVKPRPILIELLTEFKRREIIYKRQTLKGTNIFISEDLILEDREEKKVLVEHLKLARSKNKLAQLKGNKLIIEGESYSYSDIVGNKLSAEPSGYYSPPPGRKVASVPVTPSESGLPNLNDQNLKKLVTEHQNLHEPNIEIPEKLLVQEINTHGEGDTEEKKRKFEGSPNKSTGAVPKIAKTRSGSKNRKNP